MRAAPFRYVRPTTLEEAIGELAGDPEGARVLAGGQSLVPALNSRAATPRTVVDIKSVPGLRTLAVADGTARIGALSTHRDLQQWSPPGGPASGRLRLLAAAAASIGYEPIRVRGTIGGSVAHADPRAEWCVVAALLDAELVLLGPTGVRAVPASDFFLGRHLTAVQPGELLVEVRVAAGEGRAAIVKHGHQPSDIGLVCVAASATVTDGAVTSFKIAVGGIADRPVRLDAVERQLEGSSSTVTFADVADLCAQSVQPIEDAVATAGYRTRLVRALSQKATQAVLSAPVPAMRVEVLR